MKRDIFYRISLTLASCELAAAAAAAAAILFAPELPTP